MRAVEDAVADRAVLVGGYDPGALDALRRGVLSPDALTGHGAAETQQTAIYQHLHSMTGADLGKTGHLRKGTVARG